MLIQSVSAQNNNQTKPAFGIKFPSRINEGWNLILDSYSVEKEPLVKKAEELKAVLKQIQYDYYTKDYSFEARMSTKSSNQDFDNQYFIMTNPEGKKTVANISVKYKKNHEGLLEQIEGAINYFKGLIENNGEKLKKEFEPMTTVKEDSYAYGDGLRFSFRTGFD